jgi:hypothetical protein
MSTTQADLIIRYAAAADLEAAAAVRRLAELDEAPPPPAGPVLLAERAGRPIAARPLAGSETVADPFEPTADAVALLELRARQLLGGMPQPRRRRILRLAYGR